jgi:hypothetical protein
VAVEPPVACGDLSPVDVHAPWANVLGATWVGYQVIQQREPVQTVRWAPLGMMEPAHHEQLPVDGMVGLIQPRAGHWQTGVVEDRLPGRFLGPDPVPYALAVDRPRRVHDMIRNVAQVLAERQHAYAVARASPVQEPRPPRVARLADRGRDGCQLPGKRVDRMAEAMAQARLRKARAQALDGAFKPSHAQAADPRGGLWMGRGAVKRAIGLGQGRRPHLLAVAQRPAHAAPDTRREGHVVGQTMAGLCISQDRRRPGQTTPCPHRDEMLVAEGADATRDGHGGDMAADRAQFPTEPSRPREQGGVDGVRTHGARAQDQGGEDRAHRATRGTLAAPARPPMQTDANIMRVARQTPSAATGCLVCQLKAEGEAERHPQCAKGVAGGTELKGGCFVRKIDGDGPVFACRFGCFPQVLPPGHQVSYAHETRGGEHIEISRQS